MNNKEGIVYFTLDYLVQANTLFNDLRNGIKTKGYHMKRNGDNLLVCTGFIGRPGENSITKYKLDNNKIINIQETKGIKAIRPKSFLTETNVGSDWKLENFMEKPILVPEDNVIYRNSDGSLDLRFR